MRTAISRLGRYMNRPDKAGYFFLLPSMAVLLVFMFVPLLVSVVFSTLKFDIMWNQVEFVGFGNFIRAFGDGRFLNALGNTALYTLAVVPGQIGLGLLAALAIHKPGRLNVAYRGIFFMPVVCSMTIIAIIWMFLLDPDLGTISYYLTQFGVKPVAFLKTPDLALPTVIIVGIWKEFAFSMVILIASLNDVPVSYYEAAGIDGAGPVAKFFRITLPMILPSLAFLVINAVIKSFQVFDQVFIMNGGGPMRRTETVVQYIYTQGFKNLDMGYASAIAELLFLIILVVSVLTFGRMQRPDEKL